MVTEGHMTGTQYVSTWERGRTSILAYSVITIEGVMYLKDRSPYLDSSFLVVNLRIQLELICWALYSTVDTPLRRVCLHYLAQSAHPVV